MASDRINTNRQWTKTNRISQLDRTRHSSEYNITVSLFGIISDLFKNSIRLRACGALVLLMSVGVALYSATSVSWLNQHLFEKIEVKL